MTVKGPVYEINSGPKPLVTMYFVVQGNVIVPFTSSVDDPCLTCHMLDVPQCGEQKARRTSRSSRGDLAVAGLCHETNVEHLRVCRNPRPRCSGCAATRLRFAFL